MMMRARATKMTRVLAASNGVMRRDVLGFRVQAAVILIERAGVLFSVGHTIH